MAKNDEIRDPCPNCGTLSYIGSKCPKCGNYRRSKGAKTGDNFAKGIDEYLGLPLGMRLKNLDKTEEQVEERISLWHENRAKRIKSQPTFSEEDFRQATIVHTSVIKKLSNVSDGELIQVLAIPWKAIVEYLDHDWNRAYGLGWRKWEEIIAGAYSKAGFDIVNLTNKSGDFGRDVEAIKKGFCSVKIIDSVKAYHSGHLVTANDVRALMGVVANDPTVSKGIISTTSDFAPGILSDPFIKPALPTRLDLMNGKRLMEWFNSLKDLS